MRKEKYKSPTAKEKTPLPRRFFFYRSFYSAFREKEAQ